MLSAILHCYKQILKVYVLKYAFSQRQNSYTNVILAGKWTIVTSSLPTFALHYNMLRNWRKKTTANSNNYYALFRLTKLWVESTNTFTCGEHKIIFVHFFLQFVFFYVLPCWKVCCLIGSEYLFKTETEKGIERCHWVISAKMQHFTTKTSKLKQFSFWSYVNIGQWYVCSRMSPYILSHLRRLL